MKKAAAPSPANLRAQLHNGVCQTLTAVHLLAAVLAKKLKKISPAATKDMQELEKLITQARAELYEVVKR